MHPEHPMRDGLPPEWATAYGFDAFGPFAEFEVGPVRQRMRWIPPGEFWMGSPEDEPGRYEREVRHRVTLTRGYWMGDTPVTQALWEAVMGSNPSRFVHPQRPVERVSWRDVQGFIRRLNERVPGLDVGLPTEAEWERACRAGTDMATYVGDLEILGIHHAPGLDAIAWYGGNSGVDFDLEDGYDPSDWPEKQHPHTKAGTRVVGLKAPNVWGLFDTLGNVREWCADWQGDYDGAAVDPVGPEWGISRVVRGGAWDSHARNVRAAYRHWYEPGYCLHYLGFRLARGHGAQGEAPSQAE